MDKYNFRIIMVIISIIEMTVSVSIYFFATSPVIFVIENLLVATCLSGTFTTITPLFNKVFKDVGTEMYGLSGMFIGVASFLGPVLTKILIKDENTPDYYYLIIYSVGGGLCLIKFIFLFFFDENSEYQFKSKQIPLVHEDIGGITSNRETSMD